MGRQLGNGVTKDRSSVSKQKEAIAESNPSKSQKTQTTDASPSTPGSLPIDNSATESDKLTSSRKRSRNVSDQNDTSKSTATSLLASTSRDPNFLPFWNTLCVDESKRLWLPTATALHDLAQNSSNGFFNSTTHNSWCSMTSKQILLNYSQKISL